MASRDDLVRGYALAISELVHDGINAGKEWVHSRTPFALRKLVKSFDPEALYAILDNKDHPDQARGIARQLSGHDSFAALLQCTDVDYRDPYFLGGFVRGVIEELTEIPNEAIQQLELSKEAEAELMAEYLPPMRSRFSALFRRQVGSN